MANCIADLTPANANPKSASTEMRQAALRATSLSCQPYSAKTADAPRCRVALAQLVAMRGDAWTAGYVEASAALHEVRLALMPQ